MAADQIEVVLIIVRALDGLEIPYVVGGSFASSIHGMAQEHCHLLPRCAERVTGFSLNGGRVRGIGFVKRKSTPN